MLMSDYSKFVSYMILDMCLLLADLAVQQKSSGLVVDAVIGKQYTSLLCIFDLFVSKETVSSAGTADGIQGERRISFRVSYGRTSHRLRKPSGTRSRVGSGGAADLPKVNLGSHLRDDSLFSIS